VARTEDVAVARPLTDPAFKAWFRLQQHQDTPGRVNFPGARNTLLVDVVSGLENEVLGFGTRFATC
jgi:hypothetical protein